VKLRAYSGASLSGVDLISDVIMIMEYIAAKRNGFALGVFFIVVLSTCFQLFLVFIQNRKMGKRRIAVESLYALAMIKPAVDSARVASGKEKEVKLTVEYEVELQVSRVFETLFESIPSVIVQG
jgi:hypothetical protein